MNRSFLRDFRCVPSILRDNDSNNYTSSFKVKIQHFHFRIFFVQKYLLLESLGYFYKNFHLGKNRNELCKNKKMDDIPFIKKPRPFVDKFLSARKNHFVTLGPWYCGYVSCIERRHRRVHLHSGKPSRMLYRLYAFRLCALFHRRRSKSLPNAGWWAALHSAGMN